MTIVLKCSKCITAWPVRRENAQIDDTTSNNFCSIIKEKLAEIIPVSKNAAENVESKKSQATCLGNRTDSLGPQKTQNLGENNLLVMMVLVVKWFTILLQSLSSFVDLL